MDQLSLFDQIVVDQNVSPDIQTDRVIYTFGYGNSKLEEFQKWINEHENVMIIDCRRGKIPTDPQKKYDHLCVKAYTYEWYAVNLQKVFGDRYEWHGYILGNRIEDRPEMIKASDWCFLSPFVLPDIIEFFRLLKERLEQSHKAPHGLVPVFLCAEKYWGECHRQFVASIANQYVFTDWVVEHIGKKSK